MTAGLKSVRRGSSSSMPMAIAVLLAGLMPSAALADRKAGDACAAGLPSAPKQIYESVAANLPPTAEQGRAAVIAATEQMVVEGKLKIWDARPAGEAAGKCLEILVN